jgi:hypothetical protein
VRNRVNTVKGSLHWLVGHRNQEVQRLAKLIPGGCLDPMNLLARLRAHAPAGVHFSSSRRGKGQQADSGYLSLRFGHKQNRISTVTDAGPPCRYGLAHAVLADVGCQAVTAD